MQNTQRIGMMVHLRSAGCSLVINANIDIPTMFRGIRPRNPVSRVQSDEWIKLHDLAPVLSVCGRFGTASPRNSWVCYTNETRTHDDRLGPRRVVEIEKCRFNRTADWKKEGQKGKEIYIRT